MVAARAGNLPEDVPWPVLLLAAGALALLLVLFRLLDIPAPDVPAVAEDSIDFGRKFGLFLALVAAAAIACGGWRANSERTTGPARGGPSRRRRRRGRIWKAPLAWPRALRGAPRRYARPRGRAAQSARRSASLPAHALGAEAEQLHEVAARAERVGDRGARVELDRGPELVAHLREQQFADGREEAVQRGEGARRRTRRRAAARRMVRVVLVMWAPLVRRFDLSRIMMAY